MAGSASLLRNFYPLALSNDSASTDWSPSSRSPGQLFADLWRSCSTSSARALRCMGVERQPQTEAELGVIFKQRVGPAGPLPSRFVV